MKKILAIVFLLSVFLVPTYAQLPIPVGQLLGPIISSVGGSALKGAGEGIGNAVSKKVESKVAEKVEKMTTKKLDKMWPDEEPSDSTGVSEGSVGVLGGLSTIMGAFSSELTNGISTLMEGAQSAANAPLRDFSEKNAVRKEHNLTLEYDEWD